MARLESWVGVIVFVGSALFNQAGVNADSAVKTEVACPSDVKVLSELLLADLPSYTNRVIQRQQVSTAIRQYFIVASQPEFDPIALAHQQYQPVFPDQRPEQVFFTSLVRQYFFNRIEDWQFFHWLFLAETQTGWRLVAMYSRRELSSENGPVSPLQESSNSYTAQAIELWLRDCRAGAIKISAQP